MAVLNQLSSDIGELLSKRRYLLSTAESCTGGFLAKIITDIPGSSLWYDRGFITYSNLSKQEMLGVSKKTLDHFGAVSQVVAEEMARGALDKSQAQVSVAITGIAGPDGGSAEKPVGTVWIAWAQRSIPVISLRYLFPGNREAVRTQTVMTALIELKRLLTYEGEWR